MPSESSTQKTIDLSQTDVAWNALTAILDAFSRAWESLPPEPILDEFVPDPDSPHRLLALIELIKVDLEHRAKNGLALPSLEEYASRWPDVLNSRDDIPPDLVFEDYQIRRRHHDDVDLDDYMQRFPAAAAALKRIVHGGPDRGASTSILAVRRIAKFEPGQKIDDFDLLVQLGKGAFATVFLARQNSMQRLVALKVSPDQGFEPQTLAQLDHPNIVRVYDQRQLTDHHVRLMYMQYLAGGTLREALDTLKSEPRDQWNGQRFVRAIDDSLRNRGEEPSHSSIHRQQLQSLSWPQVVCQIGEHLADALAYAHDRNVLHRDIKPANVLLSSEGVAKLVDFNVSFSGAVEGASPATFFGGSLIYMSPEQLEACDPNHPHGAEDLDGRSDIYSLGVLLFELLTGERPFGAEFIDVNWRTTLAEMIVRRQRGVPTHRLQLVQQSRGVPELLNDAIIRCLSADPADRFSSASDLARQLHWANNPEAEQLLRTPKIMTTPVVGGIATMMVLLLLIVPNVLAAAFVYAYNGDESVPESLWPVFWKTQSITNGIAFPLATGLILYAIVPVALTVRQIAKSHRPTDDFADQVEQTTNGVDQQRICRARTQNLLLGHWGACVCFPLWAIAGVLYPAVLSRQGIALPQNAWVDFVGSHFLAGIISASYIFFGITCFCLRAWQPQLLRASITTPLDDATRGYLQKLTKLVPFYQLLSAVIPFVAISFLVIWGEARNRFALSVLSVTSMVGTVALLWFSKRLQTMVTAMQKLA